MHQLITERRPSTHRNLMFSTEKRQHAPFPVCAHFHAILLYAPRADALERVSSPASSRIVLLLWLFGPREPPRQRKDNGPIACYHSSAGALQIHIYKSVHISSYILYAERVLSTSGRQAQLFCWDIASPHYYYMVYWRCTYHLTTIWANIQGLKHTHLFFLSRSRLTSVCCCCLRCVYAHAAKGTSPAQIILVLRFKVISVKRLASRAAAIFYMLHRDILISVRAEAASPQRQR